MRSWLSRNCFLITTSLVVTFDIGENDTASYLLVVYTTIVKQDIIHREGVSKSFAINGERSLVIIAIVNELQHIVVEWKIGANSRCFEGYIYRVNGSGTTYDISMEYQL